MALASLLPEGIGESPINGAQEFRQLHQPRRERLGYGKNQHERIRPYRTTL